jgi:YD repeat-containing protein
VELRAVTSSMVSEMGYDSLSRVLEVRFRNGKLVRYTGVSQEDAAEVEGSESIGKELRSRIMTGHSFEYVKEA